MTNGNTTPPALNVEIGALLVECRVAALATAHAVEALQNRPDALHLAQQLAILSNLAGRVVEALDEAMAALWGALGLASVDAANDRNGPADA